LDTFFNKGAASAEPGFQIVHRHLPNFFNKGSAWKFVRINSLLDYLAGQVTDATAA
jgi:spore maturation protein SpmB